MMTPLHRVKTSGILVLLLTLVGLAALPTRSQAASATARPFGTARSGNFGLGLMLGEPTGISAKLWTARSQAYDFGLSYSFGERLEFLADYLWHFPTAFSGAGADATQFIPYVGIGGVIFINTRGSRTVFSNGRLVRDDDRDSVNLGVRIPLGVEFLPRSAPVGIFAELAPGISVIPSVFGFIQGAIGARFYF